LLLLLVGMAKLIAIDCQLAVVGDWQQPKVFSSAENRKSNLKSQENKFLKANAAKEATGGFVPKAVKFNSVSQWHLLEESCFLAAAAINLNKILNNVNKLAGLKHFRSHHWAIVFYPVRKISCTSSINDSRTN
jgi:hypothetical protein